MDSLDLLAREDEFKKLNKQLEKKTESLMKEIEKAMQKQDIFAEFSHSLVLSPIHNYNKNIKKHCCDTPKLSTTEGTPKKNINRPKSSLKTKNGIKNTKVNNNTENNDAKPCKCSEDMSSDNALFSNDCASNDKCADECSNKCVNCAKNAQMCDENDERRMKNSCGCFSISRNERIEGDLEFLYAFVSVSVEENVLPKSFLKDRPTVEGVCKFLSSKVKLLQDQINQLQDTLDKKSTQCTTHLSQLTELESERLSLTNSVNSLRAVTARTRAQLAATQKRLEDKERLYKEQRSEADKLSSEAKRLRAKNASVEARCASQEQSIENLKHQIELAKRAEKEIRDSARALSTTKANTVKDLERRISLLNTRVSKQNALIDNLRRQRALLTAEGAVSGIEKEYSEILMA